MFRLLVVVPLLSHNSAVSGSSGLLKLLQLPRGRVIFSLPGGIGGVQPDRAATVEELHGILTRAVGVDVLKTRFGGRILVSSYRNVARSTIGEAVTERSELLAEILLLKRTTRTHFSKETIVSGVAQATRVILKLVLLRGGAGDDLNSV